LKNNENSFAFFSEDNEEEFFPHEMPNEVEIDVDGGSQGLPGNQEFFIIPTGLLCQT